ncbi:MAG TPA: c-type cytochrome [Candidatus Sulfotelmatobacter sp.]|nr:c-type cytochrome [Candidatus Sulfotelmatobacter sp.]
MGKFVIGFIVGLVAVFGAVYFYFASGKAPVAVTAPAMPFERTLARMTLHARIDKEAPKTSAITPDEAAYTAGAQIYKDHCAVCHGLPGQEQTAIAKGMFPKPPKLMEGTGVTDDPAGETYWKVSGGIRMTGMPGFEKTLSTTQMWQVSLLLANFDKVPATVKASLIPAVPAPPAAPEPARNAIKK